MEINKKELEQMQSVLEVQSSNNADEVQERIMELSVYMARSGELLAYAKQALRKKRTSEISQHIIEIVKQAGISAKVQNAILDSLANEEAFFVDWLDRINRACTHQIDGLRSVLSYEKEQLRLREVGY